ncbi:nibrin homolog [Humulus lupulus]|uniref:nibrin homolog n=1 Tax=Humulus lupulus TaxID=3486 RepID=UPI002B408374|nr:nibrin homolog [Humulus lupulus]
MVSNNFHQKCTYVLVDELTPLREKLLDAIVAKKACVRISWVERVAEEKICNEIPSYSNHTATLSAEGVSVKLADQGTRENCMEGYTFVLDSINSESKHEENSYVVCVIPGGSPYKFDCFNKIKVSSVKEIDLMCAVLTGTLDRSILISPCGEFVLFVFI